MENKANETDWVLNPNTNRYIKKNTALHKRLVKSGVLSQAAQFKQPALVVEKKTKAVANIKDLNKTELDDIYEQIKVLRSKQDKTIERRGRPIGISKSDDKPTVKGLLKPASKLSLKPVVKKEPAFKVSVKTSKPKTDTEFDFTDED